MAHIKISSRLALLLLKALRLGVQLERSIKVGLGHGLQLPRDERSTRLTVHVDLPEHLKDLGPTPS